MRVLVVEDDEAFRNLLLEYLSKCGHDVEAYDNASSFLSLLHSYSKEHLPDVILMDVKMQGINGIDFLRMTHGLKTLPPIIMMSAFGSDHTVENAKKWGALKFLKKPFSLKILLDTLVEIDNTEKIKR